MSAIILLPILDFVALKYDLSSLDQSSLVVHPWDNLDPSKIYFFYLVYSVPA